MLISNDINWTLTLRDPQSKEEKEVVVNYDQEQLEISLDSEGHKVILQYVNGSIRLVSDHRNSNTIL